MNSARGRKFTVFGVALTAMGLLLWARLILVTGHPRTATATPDRRAAGAAPGPSREAGGASPKPGSPVAEVGADRR